MTTAAQGDCRSIEITAGNLRQSHLNVQGLYDFLPPDIVGESRRDSPCEPIEILFDGFDEVADSDLRCDDRTGEPRGYLRCRGLIGRFYQRHNVQPGERVTLQRLAPRQFRLLPPPKLRPARGKLRAAEFFAGIGLVRLALQGCGWDVVFANDIDEAKAEMYRHNWPEDDHLLVNDIHRLTANDLPDCELFTASFPCNDLSIAGKWEGLNGKESSAFWGLTRLLDELGDRKPATVLLENVVGMLLRNGGNDLDQALMALNGLGYAVDVMILNAKQWTPQSRARLFIVGRLKDDHECKSFSLACDARPQSLMDFVVSHPDIRWDLQDLPHLPDLRPQLRDILEELAEDDPQWWSQERADYFMTQLSPRHADLAQEMIGGKDHSYATAFRRVRHGRSMAELRTDGIAGCLRTPRGGSGRQILLMAGRGQYKVRLLTARECARLQGVPDEYVIDVPLNQALFGFGDAVCVPAVAWILRNAVSRNAPAARGHAVGAGESGA